LAKKNTVKIFVVLLGLCGTILTYQNCSKFGTKEFSSVQKDSVSQVGYRRLSRIEFDNTLYALLGDDTNPARRILPEDVAAPFDNDFETQVASAPFVSGIETMAIDVATRFLQNTPQRDSIIGCVPSGAGDTDCLKKFVTDFGRSIFRRTLTVTEVQNFVDLGSEFSSSENDFYSGIDVVLRVFLQSPEFIYRIEIGYDSGSELYRLTDFEIATRLSYFILGTTPDKVLLDLAENKKLNTAEQLRAQASRLLELPQAVDRMDHFHALWLGYHQLPHPPALTTAMREESKALVKRIIFSEDRPWWDIFLLDETYIDQTLASHYGISGMQGPDPQWVKYVNSARMGLLSHGSFLSVNTIAGDTSPTLRGKLIRNQLLCQEIPPPPPTVNVDEPPQDPEGSPCKWDRYKAHREVGSSCLGCHQAIDPIGFGLENFDQAGVFRTTDNGLPQCPIKGEGDITGIGIFQGPKGLSQLLVDKGIIGQCMIRRLYEFAMGHRSKSEEDETFIKNLEVSFNENGMSLKRLIVEFVSSSEFFYKKEYVQ
jgi:hypothetical protein